MNLSSQMKKTIEIFAIFLFFFVIWYIFGETSGGILKSIPIINPGTLPVLLFSAGAIHRKLSKRNGVKILPALAILFVFYVFSKVINDISSLLFYTSILLVLYLFYVIMLDSVTEKISLSLGKITDISKRQFAFFLLMYVPYSAILLFGYSSYMAGVNGIYYHIAFSFLVAIIARKKYLNKIIFVYAAGIYAITAVVVFGLLDLLLSGINEKVFGSLSAAIAGLVAGSFYSGKEYFNNARIFNGSIFSKISKKFSSPAPSSLEKKKVEKARKENKPTTELQPNKISLRIQIGQVSQKMKEYILKQKKKILIASSVLVGVVIVYFAAVYIMNVTFVKVALFTPEGTVSQSPVIRVEFNEPVSIVEGEKEACINISPAVSGTIAQESPNVIVFTPKEELKPSTFYSATINGKALKSTSGKSIPGESIKFNTQRLLVLGDSLIFNYDYYKDVEKEVVGQLTFNWPVNIETLKEYVKVTGDGKNLNFTLEKSSFPGRVYIRSGVPGRGDEVKDIFIVVKSGLNCINGGAGLAKDYVKKMSIPKEKEFMSTEIKLWHEAGNSFISVLYNMPVEASQVRSHVKINPETPFTVKTEYCYAVISADFKPNVSYEVSILPGMVSKNGEIMKNEYAKKESIKIEDKPSSAEFAHRGNILPAKGQMNIEIRTVNLDSVRVSINKIFKNGINRYLRESSDSSTTPVFYGDYPVVSGKINESIPGYINLKKFHSMEYKGMFEIRLSDTKGRYIAGGVQKSWVLCTDLGIIAKEAQNKLFVTVLSLSSLEPVSNATVKILSSSDQVMYEGVTDISGRAVFNVWREKRLFGKGVTSKLNADLITAEKDEDYSFMRVSNSLLNQHRFNVSGDANQPKSREAFVFSERGVYRPGEKVFVTAVVRNRDMSVPPPFTLNLTVRGPSQGNERRFSSRPTANGTSIFEFTFPPDIITGPYTAEVTDQSGNWLGSCNLKVEEFIPDKLKVAIKTKKQWFGPDEKIIFTTSSMQLFGAPASGNRVETGMRVTGREYMNENFKGYVFRDPTKPEINEFFDLGKSKLDAAGMKEYSLDPFAMNPPSALRVVVMSEVFDSGGRPVSAYKYIDVNNYETYYGIKQENKPSFNVGEKVKIDCVALGPDGGVLKERPAEVLIKRKVWYSIFRQTLWGRNNYESNYYEEVVKSEKININGKAEISFVPDIPGEYSVLVGDFNGMKTGKVIRVTGAGDDSVDLESAETLKLILDKAKYKSGEIAYVTVNAPFSGKILLGLERDEVFQSEVFSVNKGVNTLPLTVSGGCFPNAFVVGLLIRPATVQNSNLPMTSFGVIELKMDTEANKVNFKMDVPVECRSAKGIDVALTLPEDGIKGTDVVIMAVDEGILQITNQMVPEPGEYFFRKKSLQTSTFTLFNDVLPEIKALREAVGGGEGADFDSKIKKHLNPLSAKKERSMVAFSGVLTPDESGVVRYHVNTDDFAGEVRVVALALQGNKFGVLRKNVTVSEPVVVQISYPRFVAPLDQFILPVQIYNKSGAQETISVNLKTKGPAKCVNAASVKLEIQNGEQKTARFVFDADNAIGIFRCELNVEAGKFKQQKIIEIPVRPVQDRSTVVQYGSLNSGESQDVMVREEHNSYGREVVVSCSSSNVLKLLGGLDYLVRYPYGCLEQNVSTAFPLLFLEKFGFQNLLFSMENKNVEYYINEAIANIEKKQNNDGSFSIWGDSGNAGEYLNCYASHFLLEAEKNGYKVNKLIMQRLDEYINRTNAFNNKPGLLDRRDQNKEPEAVNPYLLYLKAKTGKPDKETMSFMKTKRLNKMNQAERAFLSMAYSEIGDLKTALFVLGSENLGQNVARSLAGWLSSDDRDAALFLNALVSANPMDQRINKLADKLSESLRNGRFGNTQDNAVCFIALSKVLKRSEEKVTVEVTAPGIDASVIKGDTGYFKQSLLEGKKVKLTNKGAVKAYYSIISNGIPLNESRKNFSNGIKIERRYRDEQGKAVKLGAVVQGQLVVVSILVSPSKTGVQNIIISDLLPAGFEVENIRLRSNGELGFAVENTFTPSSLDIRDDRVLLFRNELAGAETFTYTLRAITPGRFNLPGCFVEAMYDPEIKAGDFSEEKLVITPAAE